MLKEPVFNIRLSQLDKILLNSSPFFRMDVLRVTMAFRTLDSGALADLEEYADATGGVMERWLLVPSSMPLSVLGHVIDRAFGLLPSPDSSAFFLPDDRLSIFAPDIPSLIRRSGYLFFNPVEDDYVNAVAAGCSLERAGMAPPYETPHMSYEDCRTALEGFLRHVPERGIRYDGALTAVEDIPVTPAGLLSFSHATGELLVSEIAPYIPYPYVLAKEGAPLCSPEAADRVLCRRAYDERSRGARPVTHTLIYRHMSYADPDKGFSFSVTRPKDVREILHDGYLDLESYIDSVRYVASCLLPDCLAKIGYDLFGEDEDDYHAFIMRLHGPSSGYCRSLAEEAGWREPYIDRKRVLR